MADITQQEIAIKPKKPFDPVASLTRHWFKIVVFGGILFILLSPLSLLLRNPSYLVSGKLVVLPKSETMISRTDESSIGSYYHQFINTQLDVIKSPKILEKAIDKLPSDLKKYFMPEGMPLSIAARLLNRGLTVEQPRSTHFINITLKRGNSEGLVEMLNTIMEVYIEEYQNEEEGKEHRRLSYLYVEKENLKSEIENKTDLLKKITEELASSVYSGYYNDDASQFEKAYEIAYRDRLEKEKKLKAIIREADALKKLPLNAYIQDTIAQNTVVNKLDTLAQESLYKLRDSQVGLSNDNPGKHQLEERMKDIKEYTSEQKETIREDTEKFLYEKREIELQEKIIHAETELNTAKMIEEEILVKRNELLATRGKTSTKELTRQEIAADLEQMKIKLNTIDTRFYELKLESKAPGKITLERMADSPGIISGSNLKKLIALIFIFAFGSITGLCMFFDILDDRIRSEKDIFNSLGTQPHRPIDDYLQVGMKGAPFIRVLLDDPTNKVAQAIHSLAIKFDKERKNHEAKVAVFTGVDPKSGVTEILLNTAYAMSKLCSKILVIETNFANPSLKKLLNIEKDKKGLFDFIEGQTSVSDCISHDRERGIDILLSGHIPSDDELVNLDRSKISTLIEDLKTKYDFILIDTMPMLISDLAEFLIVQADIVPLVIQGDRSLYKLTYMAGQTLFKLEVPAIATVLNLGAPKYKTKLEETVFQLLSPVQEWIKNIFMKTFNPSPEEPYPLFRMSWKSANLIGSSFKQSLKKGFKIINRRALINTFKSIFILFIFVQFTLLLSFMTSTANNVDIYNENLIRRKINKPPKTTIDIDGKRKVLQQINDHIPSEPAKVSDKPIKEVFTAAVTEQELYEEKVIKDENWILKQDPDLYTIQIMSSRNKEAIIHYVNTHGIEDKVAYYYKIHNGKGWYSLMYGIYPGWSKAMADLKQFPDELNISSPWIQRIGNIQDKIQTKESLIERKAD